MPDAKSMNPAHIANPDVLQAPPHAPLSAEVVAKAVARHKREHPAGKANVVKPKKRR